MSSNAVVLPGLEGIKSEIDQVTVPPQGGYVAKQCARRASNDNDASYDSSLKEDDSEEARARMNEGITFEAEIATLWKSQLGDLMAVIPECDRTLASKKKREDMTMSLLEEPGEVIVIWNARIPAVLKDSRIAEPDALVRMGDKPKENGKWAWTSVDVKHHRSLEGTSKETTWSVSNLNAPLQPYPTNLGKGKPNFKDSEQLAHYRRVLEHYGYGLLPYEPTDYSDGGLAEDSNIAGIIGKEKIIVWRDLDEKVKDKIDEDGTRVKKSAQEVYDEAFAFRLAVIKRAKQRALDASLLPLVTPEWKADECPDCPWRTVCHDELKIDLDHITLMQGITPSRAKAHYANNVLSIAQLARLDYITALAVDSGVDTLKLLAVAKKADESTPIEHLLEESTKLVTIQKLKAAGIFTAKEASKLDRKTAAYGKSGVWNLAWSIDQARTVKVDRVHMARGLKKLSIPRATIEEDVDIEDCDGIVYMIGVRVTGRRKREEDLKVRTEYYCFEDYTHTLEGELRVFSEWWNHMQTQRLWAKKNKWSRKVFCYSSKEVSTFRALALKHVGKPGVPTVEELNGFFNTKDWIDMFEIISKETMWPTENLTLKSVAKRIAFTWRDQSPSGLASTTWYREAVNNPDPKVRAFNQERLRQYNADDVHAQTAIRDWLTRLTDETNRLTDVSVLDKRFRRRSLQS